VGKAEVQQLVTGKVVTVQFVDPLRLTLAKDGKVDAFGTASAIRAIGTWERRRPGAALHDVAEPGASTAVAAILRGDRGLGMTKDDGTGFFVVSEIK
jgi:hypothetical protein